MDDDVREIYRRLIDGWNRHDAAAMAERLAEDALVVGFDGSQMVGRAQFEQELTRIFADHRTAAYVTKVRSVRMLGADAAVLHAVAGMVPPDGNEIMPDRKAVQTVVAAREDGTWWVTLFQSTPARFDGRPDLSAALTAELAEIRRAG